TVFVFTRSYTSATVWYIPFCFFLLYSLGAIAESVLVVYRRFRLLLGLNVFYTVVFLWLHNGVLGGSLTIDELFLYLLPLLLFKLLVTLAGVHSCLKSPQSKTTEQYTMADIRSLWLHIGIYDVLQRVFTWIDKFAISM